MFEHRRTIPGDVFIEQDVSVSTAQQSRQGRLALEEREIPQILTIVLDQVEGVENRAMCGDRRRSSNRDKPSGPSTTASPSIVKLLALIRSAAEAIAGSLAVQS